jgi:hypothetical protein
VKGGEVKIYKRLILSRRRTERKTVESKVEQKEEHEFEDEDGDAWVANRQTAKRGDRDGRI